MSVLIPFVIVAVLGALLGFGLAIADKKLAVKKDPKLIALEEMMPGANCGGCGFAGCSAYAEAVFSRRAQIGLCSPGGKALADRMAETIGEASVEVKPRVAHVFCAAPPEEVKKDFDYSGLEDCNAASILFKGSKSCKYGCLGLGSCIKVCPAGAIERLEDGRIHVRTDICIGCGKCEKACPNGVIRLVDAGQKYFVSCNSKDKGPVVRACCPSGCIGCLICEKKHPGSGFKVESFLASYSSQDADDEASEAALASCPRKIIGRAE
ncbi:MAG: RnfABCDGE type electron transport complex subunit B [Spirochaetales bacterium]|nr:RnfABCDGE type electron transport complex subunit B [Spirochaetales bacterium]